MPQDMKSFILAIILIGLTLVFGIFIVSTMQGNFRATNTAGSVTNESVTGLAVAGDNLAKYTLLDVVCTITAVMNSSDNVSILTSGNWTGNNCNLTGIAASPFLTYNVKATYTYTYTADTQSSNASGDVTDALSSGTAWITILIVVGFAVIVLGMLSEGLGRAVHGRQEAGLTY